MFHSFFGVLLLLQLPAVACFDLSCLKWEYRRKHQSNSKMCSTYKIIATQRKINAFWANIQFVSPWSACHRHNIFRFVLCAYTVCIFSGIFSVLFLNKMHFHWYFIVFTIRFIASVFWKYFFFLRLAISVLCFDFFCLFKLCLDLNFDLNLNLVLVWNWIVTAQKYVACRWCYWMKKTWSALRSSLVMALLPFKKSRCLLCDFQKVKATSTIGMQQPQLLRKRKIFLTHVWYKAAHAYQVEKHRSHQVWKRKWLE